MLKGHRKIRSDIGMAAVTQLGLSFRQQKLGRRGLVNRVALCARNVVERVRGTANICAHEIVRVALQTGIDGLFRCEVEERDNRRFASVSLDMRGCRPMAALTARVCWFLFTARYAFKVCILVKLEPNIGMTCLTNRTTGVQLFGCLLRV